MPTNVVTQNWQKHYSQPIFFFIYFIFLVLVCFFSLCKIFPGILGVIVRGDTKLLRYSGFLLFSFFPFRTPPRSFVLSSPRFAHKIYIECLEKTYKKNLDLSKCYEDIRYLIYAKSINQYLLKKKMPKSK